MKRASEEIIYRANIVFRIFMFFLFYWWCFTLLLFLSLFTFNAVYFGLAYIGALNKNETGPLNTNDNDLFVVLLFLGLSVLTGIGFWKSLKSILRPVKLTEGLIIDKEEYDYDEGKCFYIHLKPGHKAARVEINEKTFKKLRVGNRVKISYSNKLDQPLKIVLVKNPG